MLTPPTQEQLFHECLGDPVSIEIVKEHGNGIVTREVFCREEDDTYWQVEYFTENQGDYNEFRDSTVDVVEVVKVLETITKYVKK